MNEDNFLIREESDTDPDFGRYPSSRSMEEYIRKGIVVIDKPMGPTSHEVVTWIRKMLELNRTGHSGTLDPRVTGVLPVLLGDATKLAEIFQKSDKEYVCLMKLHSDADVNEIKNVMKKFTGLIYQKPPLKSAVRRRLRIRKIHEIKIIEIDGRDILFRVVCDAGTYVRKLCYDIGEVLGTGAHMHELRRTRSGNFKEEDSFLLQELLDAYIFYREEGEERYLREIVMPMERALSDIPKVVVKDTAVDSICHGADLSDKGISYIQKGIRPGDTVGMFTLKQEIIGTGKALMSSRDMLERKEGIAVDTEKVLMERGTYPRVWKSRK